MKRWLKKKYYPVWKKQYATRLKKRRVEFVNQKLFHGLLLDRQWLVNKRLLEIGCSLGTDFVQFYRDYPKTSIYGVDLIDKHIVQDNFHFFKMDAEHLDFEDKYFDIVVSFGLFEHIQPIEKLCKAISEVERVAKSYVICVPSIATVFEPHVMSFYWQLRSPKKKAPHNALNYCSDDAWLQFNGFSGAKITRFWYIPLLIQDTFIYKLAAAA